MRSLADDSMHHGLWPWCFSRSQWLICTVLTQMCVCVLSSFIVSRPSLRTHGLCFVVLVTAKCIHGVCTVWATLTLQPLLIMMTQISGSSANQPFTIYTRLCISFVLNRCVMTKGAEAFKLVAFKDFTKINLSIKTYLRNICYMLA